MKSDYENIIFTRVIKIRPQKPVDILLTLNQRVLGSSPSASTTFSITYLEKMGAGLGGACDRHQIGIRMGKLPREVVTGQNSPASDLLPPSPMGHTPSQPIASFLDLGRALPPGGGAERCAAVTGYPRAKFFCRCTGKSEATRPKATLGEGPCGCGGMVDARDLKSCEVILVRVRVPPSAPLQWQQPTTCSVRSNPA